MVTAEIRRRSETASSPELRSRHFAWIKPEDLNTLTQPREEFLGIDELATSIAQIAPINEIWIAFFDNPEDCDKYVSDVNQRWKRNHTFAELTPTTLEDGTRGVAIVIAGERRTRAYLQLKKDGCLVCQEENGLAPCFNRHFPDNDGKILVKVLKNPDYNRQAVPIQEDENFHMSLPAGRLALSIFNRFESWKEENPKGSIAEFARKIVHKSPETVRNALKFAENLPDIIQAWVNSGKLKYGHALELTRMKEVGYDDLALVAAALPALNSRDKMSLGPFRKRIDNLVAAKTQQDDMLAIFRDIENEDERRLRLARTTAADLAVDLTAAAQRLDIAVDLVRHGYVNPGNSAIIKRGNVEALKKLVEREESVANTLEEHLSKATRQQIGRTAPRLKVITNELLKMAEDGSEELAGV